MPEILVANTDVACPALSAKQQAPVGICPISHTTSDNVREVYSETLEDESLRQALKLLAPIRKDFRLADYATSFNWDEISAEFQAQRPNYQALPSRSGTLSWYAVVFRSKRRTDCNNVDLFEADRLAYQEAFTTTNGSLLVYWYTDLDDDNNCLATCVWTSRDIARSVNLLPRHREAVQLSAGSYVHYNIDRCRITWLPEEERLEVTPWTIA
ncbi:hypothetical protein GGI13_000743 [Coemansia sp. RSA 455]|nr:hypothetical protein GGI14_002649 [Coemansia sp. S680]KAJ2070833.1 hypothetical protein GGH13_003758 [Coemansia sp. S155-1]KAJ2098619.1 hypothetical protein GGI09_003214 [Coemansia sp. S100]KAJ2107898.1 hypothetical protein GGI16_001345 [Coemansia sp. S142-1]KAJ2113985.1 hypothetical protein IW146_003437 [Coemansia sp. RSA 922]KAJ2257954.1 hypothetical protein GGI13_000743 [Coemansia sp. RSA 455]